MSAPPLDPEFVIENVKVNVYSNYANYIILTALVYDTGKYLSFPHSRLHGQIDGLSYKTGQRGEAQGLFSSLSERVSEQGLKSKVRYIWVCDLNRITARGALIPPTSQTKPHYAVSWLYLLVRTSFLA